MVVISAAFVTKYAVLVARQYQKISRLRLEGLLSAFRRTIDSTGKASANLKNGESQKLSDQTYVETEAVRYVYLPFDDVYLVLLTTKNSNIFQDRITLQMMQQAAQQVCEGNAISLESVLSNAFEIVFAFDEIINPLGLNDAVTLAQIKAYTAMESHEEKLSVLIMKDKEKGEQRRAQEVAQRLAKERREQKLMAAAAVQRAKAARELVI